jgi:hypothetical protein
VGGLSINASDGNWVMANSTREAIDEAFTMYLKAKKLIRNEIQNYYHTFV